MTEGLIATLRDLVAIDSTSTRSNVPIIDVLEHRLTAAGFRCERHGYVDANGQQKVNLLATRGPDGRPELALVGHSDCVPFDASWTQALTLTEEDGKLYGRGACDTKAFVSCVLHAVTAVPASEQKKPLMVLFTGPDPAPSSLSLPSVAGGESYTMRVPGAVLVVRVHLIGPAGPVRITGWRS